MGLLLEWKGQLAEDEEYFVQMERRYQDSDSLRGFYWRMMDLGKPAYEAKFQRLARVVFPGGQEKVDPARLTPVPRDGVGLARPDEDAKLFELQGGDLVVGVDGWRVHDAAQYQAVKDFDFRPEMTLYVWRRGRYRELPVRSWGDACPWPSIPTLPRHRRSAATPLSLLQRVRGIAQTANSSLT